MHYLDFSPLCFWFTYFFYTILGESAPTCKIKDGALYLLHPNVSLVVITAVYMPQVTYNNVSVCRIREDGISFSVNQQWTLLWCVLCIILSSCQTAVTLLTMLPLRKTHRRLILTVTPNISVLAEVFLLLNNTPEMCIWSTAHVYQKVKSIFLGQVWVNPSCLSNYVVQLRHFNFHV